MTHTKLKWSVYICLIFAFLSMPLAIAHIALDSSASPRASSSLFSPLAFQEQEEGILLLSLQGVIQEGNYYSSASNLIKQLEDARKQEHVQAILLEINSPGGSVGATKRLYEAVLQTREEKPVIALIHDLAASGAYYVASACTYIVASHGASIGSIGVISFHLEVHRFLQRHGIRARALKAGRFKDIGSPFRTMSKEEERMYQRLLDEFYQLFLKDISKGRKQSPAKVRGWADGKIFTASRALALGMLDTLGTQKEAIEHIKKILKKDQDLPIIEPSKDLEYYLGKFLAAFSPKYAGSLEQSFLHAPALYLYPPAKAMLWDLINLGKDKH